MRRAGAESISDAEGLREVVKFEAMRLYQLGVITSDELLVRIGWKDPDCCVYHKLTGYNQHGCAGVNPEHIPCAGIPKEQINDAPER